MRRPSVLLLAVLLALVAGAPIQAMDDRDPAAAESDAARLRIADSSAELDGVRLRWLEAGAGTPLVLLHGYTTGADGFATDGTIRALARELRVIALDCRGHGKSGKPTGADAYGAEMADDVVRVLDHLGIERAAVAGYSMGGMITMKLLERHPERLLAAIPMGFGWPEPTANRRFNESLADSLERGDGFGPLWEALRPEGVPAMTDAQRRGMDAMLFARNDAAVMAAVARGFTELQVPEAVLRANAVPVRSMIGRTDPLRAGVERMRGVLANAEFVLLDGDHMSATRDPALVRGIVEFVREHASREEAADVAPPAETKPAA